MTRPDIVWGIPGLRTAEPLPGHDALATRPLLELLTEAAARAPDADALVSRATRMSYATLLDLARRTAAAIGDAVPEGQAVACLLSEAPAAFAGLLGCLISGRPCLVIDPKHPAGRLARMLDDARPAAILTDLPTAAPPACRVLDLAQVQMAGHPSWRPRHPWDPDAPFAVYYTSGSTGQPKGIVLSARALLHRAFDSLATKQCTARDVVVRPSLHSASTGLAIGLGALATGTTVLLGSVAADGLGGLAGLLAREGLTVGSFPSVLFRAMAGSDRFRAAFNAVRVVRLGGGAVRWPELDTWRSLLPAGAAIQHTYASTEASVVARWFVPAGASGETAVPMGELVPYHDAAILDEHGYPMAPGETGELWIQSSIVTLGHWRAGRVDGSEVVPAPERPGARIFRTGDLVRVTSDGLLRHVDRTGRQIKINGVRIEPAEIEAVLRADPRVSDAAVVAVETRYGTALHGFAAAATSGPGDLSTVLRRRVMDTLPASFRLSTMTILDKLPSLPGGKPDLSAMCRLAADRVSEAG